MTVGDEVGSGRGIGEKDEDEEKEEEKMEEEIEEGEKESIAVVSKSCPPQELRCRQEGMGPPLDSD